MNKGILLVIGIIASKLLNKKKTIITYHGGGANEFIGKNQKFTSYYT